MEAVLTVDWLTTIEPTAATEVQTWALDASHTNQEQRDAHLREFGLVWTRFWKPAIHCRRRSEDLGRCGVHRCVSFQS